MSSVKLINPPGSEAIYETYKFSQATVANGFVEVSGQVGRKRARVVRRCRREEAVADQFGELSVRPSRVDPQLLRHVRRGPGAAGVGVEQQQQLQLHDRVDPLDDEAANGFGNSRISHRAVPCSLSPWGRDCTGMAGGREPILCLTRIDKKTGWTNGCDFPRGRAFAYNGGCRRRPSAATRSVMGHVVVVVERGNAVTCAAS